MLLFSLVVITFLPNRWIQKTVEPSGREKERERKGGLERGGSQGRGDESTWDEGKKS